MSNFEVGNSVKIKFGKDYDHLGVGDNKLCVGVVYDAVVSCGSERKGWLGVDIKGHPRGYCHLVLDDNGYCSDFEIIEEPSFNLKTNPWFIRVNSPEESKVVQEWLFSNGVGWIGGNFEAGNLWAQYLTNINVDGDQRGVIMWSHEDIGIHESAKELKFKFKTVLDSVIFPEVETEQEKKLKELEETIKKAAKEIQELKGM
jgi:hypothetical protein